MKLDELLKKESMRIVDVRTPAEFAEGHVEGSINIPLDEVEGRIAEFKQLGSPLILCCRSGARSGRAVEFLKSQGLSDLYNGGGWIDVQRHLS